MVSNRDSIFLSSLRIEIFWLHGTRLQFSFTYHPQIEVLRLASFGVVKVSLWFHSSLFLYFETTEGNIIALSNALFWSRHDIASLACHNPCEWIVNFGANKYMIGSSKIFLTYSPSLTQDHVWIVDGSYSPIVGTSFDNCTPNITLSFVLHARGFPINLLCINVLTNSLNCKANFFSLIVSFRIYNLGRGLALIVCKMAYMFWMVI